jgi:hypothetical protein
LPITKNKIKQNIIMAFCTFSRLNIEKDCTGLFVGGLIKDIYFANLNEVDEISSSFSNNIIDTIDMLIDPVSTDPYPWYKLQYKEDTGSAGFTLNVGNNRNVTHRVNATMQGISPLQYAALEEMMGGGEGVFIAVDSSGQAHLLGRTRGLRLVTAEGGTGAAVDDVYGAELVFEGVQAHQIEFVAPGVTIQVFNGLTTDTVTF